MKTIHELAEKYVGYKSGKYTTEELQGINDFKAGYEAAEQWIDVKDELPTDKEFVIVADNSEDWDKACYYADEKTWHFSNEFSSIGTIVKWRPINRPQ